MHLCFLKAALVAFGTFVSSSSEPLTPERAFVVIMLFTILHYRCSILPFLGSNEKSAGVSVKKLSAFLQLEEIDPDNLETREQPASGMYYSGVNINDIIMTSR